MRLYKIILGKGTSTIRVLAESKEEAEDMTMSIWDEGNPRPPRSVTVSKTRLSPQEVC